MFLQANEAQPSVLAGYCGRSQHNNQGERVVAGQHLMQAQSDIFLGWTRVTNPDDKMDRDFYVRQLRDWKFSVPIEQMIPAGMTVYAGCAGGPSIDRFFIRSSGPRRAEISLSSRRPPWIYPC